MKKTIVRYQCFRPNTTYIIFTTCYQRIRNGPPFYFVFKFLVFGNELIFLLLFILLPWHKSTYLTPRNARHSSWMIQIDITIILSKLRFVVRQNYFRYFFCFFILFNKIVLNYKHKSFIFNLPGFNSCQTFTNRSFYKIINFLFKIS